MPSARFAALLRPVAFAALSAAAIIGLAGCESDPPPRTRPTEPIVRDIPTVLSNTVGASASLVGTEPILVYGYGIVVGLNGTGGGLLDDALAAQLEREMSLRDISPSMNYEGWAIQGKTPRELLRDKNVGVVIVQAAIPPAAPEGLSFDVYVRAINATSLEGGMLWSTDLLIQQGPPGTIGGARGRRLAVAQGPVFINPFSDPATDADGVSRRTGRVLDGGMVINPLNLEIVLDESSHARARRIVEAINTRFPQESSQRLRTAMGRSGQAVEVNIPPSFVRKPTEFIEILRFMPIDTTNPDAFAKRYTDAMKEQPWLANELSLCLQGMGGDAAVRFCRTLYEYPEVAPRLAALRAGARLGDHKAADHLVQLAETGVGAERLDAITMLADVDGGPKVDLALRRLLESRELLVRIAAYESLAKRAQGTATRRALIEMTTAIRARSTDDPVYLSHRQVLLQGSIPGNNIQGVRREVIGDKFHLDIVPFGDPLIYITQQGQPKIVLFGGPLALSKPALVTAWADRLMISADAESQKHGVYYRDYRSGRTFRQDVDADLEGLIKFFARKPTPEDPTPGLNMTYSEVVGALYAIHQQRGVICAFATESDKLRARLMESQAQRVVRDRPETTGDREEVQVFEQPNQAPDRRPEGQAPTEPLKPRIIRIQRPEPNVPAKPEDAPSPRRQPPEPAPAPGDRPEQ